MNLQTFKQLIDEDISVTVTPAVKRLRKTHKAKKQTVSAPEETKTNRTSRPKVKTNYDDFYKVLNVNSHTQFENKLRDIIMDKKEREHFYDGLLDIEPRLSIDSFKPYFELYSAERKTNQQDYTPEGIASILSAITRQGASEHGDAKYTAYDMTAGTGTLLINRWNDDRTQESPWSYAPHRYFYFAEELADNSIPYLIHNLAMRGMNAIIMHGDSIERKYKQIYFLQNSSDDFLAYSDVNILPHTQDVEKEFDVREWTEEEINHVESKKVVLHYALPMKAKAYEVSDDPPKFDTVIPWKDSPRMKDIGFVERAQKGKIYPEGSIVIQISATKGQFGMLKSDGEVESKYAVITPHYWFPIETTTFMFHWMHLALPRWLRRVQEGLNVKLNDIANMPVLIPIDDFKTKRTPIVYGQQELF